MLALLVKSLEVQTSILIRPVSPCVYKDECTNTWIKVSWSYESIINNVDIRIQIIQILEVLPGHQRVKVLALLPVSTLWKLKQKVMYEYTSGRLPLLIPIPRPPLTRPFKILNNRRHKIFLTYYLHLVDLHFTSTSYNCSFLFKQRITMISKTTVRNITKQGSMKKRLVKQLSSIWFIQTTRLWSL